jgi:hypothetical protein
MARILLRISLALAAVLLVLAAAEIGLRLDAWRRLNRVFRPDYRAASESLYEYDPDIGYRCRPGATAVFVRVVNGKVVHFHAVAADRHGSIGASGRSYGEAALRIVVVGDSFTANPDTGFCWPDHLERLLERKLDRTVSVLNLACDGYGILQMVGAAARAAETLAPHVVLVAFITDDLTRGRTWRLTVAGKGVTRVLVAAQPDAAGGRKGSMDALVINPGISETWAERARHQSAASNPLQSELNAQFQRLYRENLDASVLFRADASFVFSRLARREPFYAIFRRAGFPELPFDRYEADPRFRADQERLRSAGIAIHLLHLPTRPDLRRGIYFLSSQQRRLYESLQDALGVPCTPVLAHGHFPSGSLETLFVSTRDAHPSEAGARALAEAVCSALEAASGWEQSE